MPNEVSPYGDRAGGEDARRDGGRPGLSGSELGRGDMQHRNKSQYLSLVLYKTYAELRAESARTYIGFLWWIIEPIADMATYYLVFAVLLRNRTEDFVPFLCRRFQASCRKGECP